MFSVEYKGILQYDKNGNLKQYKFEVSGYPDWIVDYIKEIWEYSNTDNENISDKYEMTGGGERGIEMEDEMFEENKDIVTYIDESDDDEFIYDSEDDEEEDE